MERQLHVLRFQTLQKKDRATQAISCSTRIIYLHLLLLFLIPFLPVPMYVCVNICIHTHANMCQSDILD